VLLTWVISVLNLQHCPRNHSVGKNQGQAECRMMNYMWEWKQIAKGRTTSSLALPSKHMS